MTYARQRAAILNDRSASFWLKRTVVELETRDPVDALADIEALRDLAVLRIAELTAGYLKGFPNLEGKVT